MPNNLHQPQQQQQPRLHPNIHIHPPTPSLLPAYKRLITTLLPIPYPPQFYTASLPPFSDSFALLAVWQSDPTPTPTPTPTTSSTSTSRPSSQKQQKQQQQQQQQQSEVVVIGGIQARIEDHSSHSSPSPSSSSTNNNNNNNNVNGGGGGGGDGSSSATEVKKKKVLYIQTLAVLAPYRGLGVGKRLLEELIEMVIGKEEEEEGEESLAEVYAHVWEVNEEGVEWYVKRGFVVAAGLVESYYRRLRPQGARVVRRRIGVGDWMRVRARMDDKGGGGGKEEEGGGR